MSFAVSLRPAEWSGKLEDSAGEEVEYVNGAVTTRLGAMRAANGHPEPRGVKIWGVGNEMYGPWQWGHIQIAQHPEKHNLFVKAMSLRSLNLC